MIRAPAYLPEPYRRKHALLLLDFLAFPATSSSITEVALIQLMFLQCSQAIPPCSFKKYRLNSIKHIALNVNL